MNTIKENFTKLNLGFKDNIAIGGWVGPLPPKLTENKNYISIENYKKIKDCEFDFVNCIFQSFPEYEKDLLLSLDCAAENEIGLFISDYALQKGDTTDNSELKKNYSKYGKHPAFLGWGVKDEPGSIMFNELAQRRDLAKSVDANKPLYYNLLPTYSTSFMLENGYWGLDAPIIQCDINEYTKHVKDFLKIVQPEFLSYDFYPFTADDKILPDYFVQLSIANRAAAESQVPFMVFVQCCKFNIYSRKPTKQEIKWQVNTSLAYGAKGIQHFTLWTPPDNHIENFTGCILESNGEITERYYEVQKINQFVKKIGEILVELSFKGLITNGTETAPIPEKDLINEDIELSGDVILSKFIDKNGGVYYLVVCNKINGSSEVSINFKAQLKLKTWTEKNIKFVEVHTYSTKLSAGEAVLIQVIQ